MYNLSEYIQALYVQSNPYGSSTGNLKVYIPSLMPLIGMGNPKITPVSLNKSCYCNAIDCKPSVASRINTQNFVTAQAPSNNYKNSCYRFGSGLKIMAKTKDCLTCKLHPEEEDNSTDWP
jgi:hypothetical protein